MMKTVKTNVLAITITTLWISISEFVRNQYWLLPIWEEHYKNMGLIFPTNPINGAIWGIWATLFSIFIFVLSKKFSLIQTTLLCWLSGFIFMWLVIGNMGVLPVKLLLYAIPLSFIEVLVAVGIIKKIESKNE